MTLQLLISLSLMDINIHEEDQKRDLYLLRVNIHYTVRTSFMMEFRDIHRLNLMVHVDFSHTYLYESIPYEGWCRNSINIHFLPQYIPRDNRESGRPTTTDSLLNCDTEVPDGNLFESWKGKRFTNKTYLSFCCWQWRVEWEVWLNKENNV